MTAAAWADLHCHSAYSFGDGASTPDELASSAAEMGYAALAITDHDNLCGAMEASHACRGVGIKPIAGCELTLTSPERCAPEAILHVTLLVESRVGWANLCRLVTEAQAHPRGTGMRPGLAFDYLEGRTEGLVCLSGCAGSGAVAGTWERTSAPAAERNARRLRDAFGKDRFMVEIQRPLWRRDGRRNRWLESLADRLGVEAVATGNAHSHSSGRYMLQDALVAIRLGRSLDETAAARRGHWRSALLSADEVRQRFADHPRAVSAALNLAERLEFDLSRDLGYRYPGDSDPAAGQRLGGLCLARLEERYADLPERPEAEARLQEELRLIESLGLSGFFWLHHEILELAREVAERSRGDRPELGHLPPGRGRGSSVSSIVCYLTGLSHVDPIRNRLSLGRFLNEELTAVPDIDLDFPREVRERLIPAVHERYGPRRSALVGAFARYRVRSAIRDLARVLGIPAEEADRAAKAVDHFDSAEAAVPHLEAALGVSKAHSARWRSLVSLLPEIEGLPRHISQHPGGMVISDSPLDELCPLQPAAMQGRTILQWDKDSCGDAGFLKIDLLGLGMLSAVEGCLTEVARSRGERIDLSRIPVDDRETWEEIRAANTTGVFQIESRAQMQMLTRTRPETLDDLTVQVALVRPGPIQGGAVHPYIERLAMKRTNPDYEAPVAHPALRSVLEETLGVIVFQDQVLDVAVALAGFSIGEAEGLRRAMSRRRSQAAISGYRRQFLEGAEARGVSRSVASRVFAQIEGFSGFGFPKSHSAAFGLLAYQSAWLRTNYAAEFLCALLNEQPMGFYPPDFLVNEAVRRGVDVLPPDVNLSHASCRIEHRAVEGGFSSRPPVRIGLGYVKGVTQEAAEHLVSERERGGGYRDIADLASRGTIESRTLALLAKSGACDRLPEVAGSGGRRRAAIWEAAVSSNTADAGSTGQLSLPLDGAAPPRLTPLSAAERTRLDRDATGLSLDRHPMEFIRTNLPPGVLDSRGLERAPTGKEVLVAGLVVVRQRPATAKGVVFCLLEDERGPLNLVIRPDIAARYRATLRSAGALLASGTVERRSEIPTVRVGRLDALLMPDGTDPPSRARDLQDPLQITGFHPIASLA